MMMTGRQLSDRQTVVDYGKPITMQISCWVQLMNKNEQQNITFFYNEIIVKWCKGRNKHELSSTTHTTLIELQ